MTNNTSEENKDTNWSRIGKNENIQGHWEVVVGKDGKPKMKNCNTEMENGKHQNNEAKPVESN